MAFNSNGNVIDLDSRRKASQKETENSSQVAENASVLDISVKRQEILQDERRKVRRTILNEFIGAFIVIPQKGLCEVTMYDISEDGLSFDMEYEKGCLKDGEEVAMRIYMNQHTYFPLIIT